MSAIRHIRREIFKVTQAEFAALAGVTQASVSRWETGTAPSLDDMHAIRAAAADRGIEWRDEWFFEPITPERLDAMFEAQGLRVTGEPNPTPEREDAA